MNRLECEVSATNEANAYANQLHPKLVEIFRPFVGLPILKADGTLLAKVAKLLPEFPSLPKLHTYKHITTYRLSWVVKTCVVGEKGDYGAAHYHESNVYV